MREVYRFRIALPFVRELLGEHYIPVHNPITNEDDYFAEGVVGDILYRRILEKDSLLAIESKESLLLGWDRRYNKRIFDASEIQQAKLLQMHLFSASGGGGEYGTWYTEGVLAERCTINEESPSPCNNRGKVTCALSSVQIGPLRFPFNQMRRSDDIFMLWSGEIVVSGRLAKMIVEKGFTGAKLQPIWNTCVPPKSLQHLHDVPSGNELFQRALMHGLDPSGHAFRLWLEEKEQLPLLEKALWEQMDLRENRGDGVSFATLRKFSQLIIQSDPIVISGNTLFGYNPLRPGSLTKCDCTLGKVERHGLLSALSIVSSSWDGADICFSNTYFGGKRGLFRPWRRLLVSKRFFDALQQEKMRGFDFEVVQLV